MQAFLEGREGGKEGGGREGGEEGGREGGRHAEVGGMAPGQTGQGLHE